MALIKCKECGKEISDKATTCIHCGCPINSQNNNFGMKLSFLKNKKGRYSILKIIGLILSPFVIWYIVSWIILFIKTLLY